MDLKEIVWVVWSGFIWLMIWITVQSNGLSGSMKCWEFLDWLRNYSFLKDSDPH
jgi:hypothetical protein